MIDTIHFWMPGMPRDSIPSGAKNFKVFSYPQGVKVCGSLSRYHLDQNFDELTHEQIKKSIFDLENDLGINLSDALISRIDLAKTLRTKSKPREMFRMFGRHPHLRLRLPMPDSVNYRNTNTSVKSIIVYDKTLSSKSRGENIPPAWKNQNALRIEVRLHKPTRCLRRKIFGRDLHSPDFYNELCDVWESEIDKIENVATYSPTSKITANSAAFEIVRYLYSRDPSAVMDALEFLRGQFTTPKELHRFRQALKNDAVPNIVRETRRTFPTFQTR